MDAVNLPPELQRFAADAVASGRFRDLSALVAAGLGLLQQVEVERAAFVRSLEAAEAEGERAGFLTIDEVCRDLGDLIEGLDRRRA